jgi:hypothetical protein
MPTTPINSDIVCENPRTSWGMFAVLSIAACLVVKDVHALAVTLLT